MSGGFFRGTSADQDTRFSNKQAKLLKTQKFPPELDQLVDMRKVQIEVIKPWIATRVTDLLGFEDEVLINFIFGLLDAKEVDGKQIQIQLTGFMEKNTTKFMRELWGLLLSAQQNASGVPQQFLDAKAEEIIKKKAESDRIVQEIQRKRDKEEKEQQLLEQQKRLDQKPMNHDAADDKRGSESKHRLESRERKSRKSGFDDRSPIRRKSPPIGRSRSSSPVRKDARTRSRSSSPKHASRSPAMRRSVSPVRRRHRSPRRSPPRRRSPYYPRRRSPSPSRRRRSPHSRRRSPELAPRRSPSPPTRRRRSPSPPRRRPRSPSPLPSPPPRRSSPERKWSLSPDQSDSPSYRSRGSLNRDAERPARVSHSSRDDYKNSRDKERRSPERSERADAKHVHSDSIAIHLREKKVAPQLSLENSPFSARSESPRSFTYNDSSPIYKRHGHGIISESPVRHGAKELRRHDSPDEIGEEEPPTRSSGRNRTRNHMYGPSESLEARDVFTSDDIASPQRQQSGKQSIREADHFPRIKKEAQGKKHFTEKSYGSEEELEYGPDPDPVTKRKRRSDDSSDYDDMEKHGRSHGRDKRRHKKSRKHRKYSDESSESESSEESERDSAKRRRREEKRRLKKEEKRQRREEKQRRKHKVTSPATPPSDAEKDAEMRERLEEETESDKQKKLEIELKERALQSFRAKKSAATH